MENLDPNNLLKIEKEDSQLKNIVGIEIIKELVSKYPNDMELGNKVRKLINSIKD